MRRFFPAIIIGLCIGIVSIARGALPAGIGYYPGFGVVSSMFGYLLAALVVAWIYRERWHHSFLSSFSAMISALLIFYLVITVARDLFNSTLFVWFPIPDTFPPWPMGRYNLWPDSLRNFALFGLLLGGICACATALVTVVQRSRSKLLKSAIFALTYAFMLWLIETSFLRRAIWAFENAERGGWTFTRAIWHSFDVGIAFLLTTILFAIGLRIAIKKSN